MDLSHGLGRGETQRLAGSASRDAAHVEWSPDIWTNNIIDRGEIRVIQEIESFSREVEGHPFPQPELFR